MTQHSANSKDRSSWIPFKHNAETGEFKRPDHDDFRTESELKARKFTGARANTVLNQAEIWIDGEVVRVITEAQAALDKDALQKAWQEVFAL